MKLCALCMKAGCIEHGSRKFYDQRRGNACSRGYDRQWRRFRSWMLARRPTCESFEGCRLLATELHHIIRLRDGGERFDPANVQPLCKRHHDKLQGEGGRG